MHLTTAQLLTLKNDILADPTLAALTPSADNAAAIAVAYGSNVSNYIIWRSNVTQDEIGNAWVGTDIDGMSALNMQRLQLLLQTSSATFDMRRADRRAGFENPFGTNVNNTSRVAMRAAWKRTGNRLEKLFATGTGTDASPAVTTVEGTINYLEIMQAMGW
jgi:hypothetical protein